MSKFNLFGSLKEKKRLKYADFDWIVKKWENENWIRWGSDNLVPDKLAYLYESSPTNSAIIDKKLYYSMGTDLLDIPVELETDRVNRGDGLYNLLWKITRDYYLYGGFSLQIIFKKRQRKIEKIIYQDFSTLRVGFSDKANQDGLYDQGVWFSEDWASQQGLAYSAYSVDFETQFYKKFDKKMLTGEMEVPQEPVFLYAFPDAPARSWYPMPDYAAGISSIFTEVELENYNLSSVENSFNPGSFLRLPDQVTPEEKEQILKDIQEDMKGTENAGRNYVLWGSPEDVIEYIPITNNIDHSGVIELEDRNKLSIITAHKIPSILANVPTQNSIGGDGSTIQESKIEFFQQVIKPSRRIIFGYLETIFSGMGIPYEIQVTEAFETKNTNNQENDA